MGYLTPPPAPAPVIVVKDVGGIVKDYQAQTEIYRRTGREVRLHECRSACTMALSLPNVCVYPDSVLKFHQAYNLRNRQTDYRVTQELFESYPPPVRARLGTLTRDYRVLSGAELIALGVRNCNEARTMVAAKQGTQQMAAASPSLVATVSGTLQGIMAGWAQNRADEAALAKIQPAHSDRALAANFSTVPVSAEVPLPPPRPTLDERMVAGSLSQTASDDAAVALDMPDVMTGAQPILPCRFVAAAQIAHGDAPRQRSAQRDD